MAVYVDAMVNWQNDNAPRCFKRKPSCHMYADTLEELHRMARMIGLKPEWFQDNKNLPHYDLTTSRRDAALRCGAVPTDRRHIVNFMRDRRRK